jgi:predicted amidophosphoribosyltransferase
LTLSSPYQLIHLFVETVWLGRDLMGQRIVKETMRAISYKKAMHAATAAGLQPCMSCGHGMTPKSRFCDHCGRPAPPPTVTQCPSCGTTNSRDARFCLQCGTAVVMILPSNPPSSLPPPPSFDAAAAAASLPPAPVLVPIGHDIMG